MISDIVSLVLFLVFGLPVLVYILWLALRLVAWDMPRMVWWLWNDSKSWMPRWDKR